MSLKLIKSYVQLSKAWYGKPNLELQKNLMDEVCVSVDNETAEIVLSWKILTNGVVGRQVSMFDDSWSAFKKCPELFLALAELNPKDASPEDVCALLKKLGFKDKTPKKQYV